MLVIFNVLFKLVFVAMYGKAHNSYITAELTLNHRRESLSQSLLFGVPSDLVFNDGCAFRFQENLR